MLFWTADFQVRSFANVNALNHDAGLEAGGPMSMRRRVTGVARPQRKTITSRPIAL
jgi:hypothetical protein